MGKTSWVLLAFALAACAGKPAQVAPEAKADAHVWRYAVRADAQGKRHAFAVDMNGKGEVALPDGLWCPHGALIDLERDGQGKVVGAKSKAEPIGRTNWMAMEKREVPPTVDLITGDRVGFEPVSGDFLPAFAIAPVQGEKQPLVVLRWQPAKDQTQWAILERRPDGLRVTEMGPWQIEHIQFQRMERPGPGLENAVLLTFQAGEGSQDAVVKVEIDAQGVKLRPLTERDAQVLGQFQKRATAAEAAVVEKILGE